MQIQDFNRVFKLYLDYFPTAEMSKEKINIYYVALSKSGLKAEDLANAFYSMVQNRVYKNFPQVAEILQYAKGTNENMLNNRIVIARELLKKFIAKFGGYKSVQFEDLGIHAVIDSLGGWQKLCQLSQSEFNKFLTFEFPKIYRAYVETPYKVNTHFLGYTDHANSTLNINYIGNDGQSRLEVKKVSKPTLIAIGEIKRLNI